jgi:hypothetical protein
LEAVHRPGRFGSIELHSEPLSRGYTDGLRGAEVIAAACPVADRPRLRVPSPVHTAAIALVHAYLADECWLDRIIPLRNVHELWRLDTHETIDWSEVHGLLRRIGRGRLVAEQLVNASRLFGAREPANTVASARAQVRFRTYEPTVRRVMAPMDKVASAIDPGRLRSYYGAQIGGPWRLRAHHLRRALRRRVR